MKIRLDKFLSLAGLGSRKKVQSLIKEKTIKVNGKIITTYDFKIDPERDDVFFNEIPIKYERFFYYKLYKTQGTITSTKDKEKTVLDLLPKDLPGLNKIFPAGRLDKDAEGLILLTNDGELAHRITHPKWKLPKVYEVTLDKPLKEEDKCLLQKGIELKEGKTQPAIIEFLDTKKTFIKITVIEGRYHLLKRMFGKLGYKVLKIKRIAMGPIALEDLKPGEWKPLRDEEIKAVKEALKLL
ncbi:MAG: pseudouridine synthase [Caldimicrobium sp.]